MLEAAQKLFFVIAMDVNAHGLQRYRASDVGIGGLVHDAHGAAADLANDLVPTDRLWDRCVHEAFFATTAATSIPSSVSGRGRKGMKTGSQMARICTLFT